MKKISKKTLIKRIKNGAYCCPICGCCRCWSTGNMASYPERWENYFCNKCKQLVGVSDNSPFIHICDDIRENIKLLSYKKILKFAKDPSNEWGQPF